MVACRRGVSGVLRAHRGRRSCGVHREEVFDIAEACRLHDVGGVAVEHRPDAQLGQLRFSASASGCALLPLAIVVGRRELVIFAGGISSSSFIWSGCRGITAELRRAVDLHRAVVASSAPAPPPARYSPPARRSPSGRGSRCRRRMTALWFAASVPSRTSSSTTGSGNGCWSILPARYERTAWPSAAVAVL